MNSNTVTLVEAIEHHITLSPELRQAFLLVDRSHFVTPYYKQIQGQWHEFTEPNPLLIYSDQAIVTQITHNIPSCSSSQPRIMAAMLEALDLEVRQKVLEIGAGTGYNAALISARVGDQGMVVSLDIDAHLIEDATRHTQNIPIPPIHFVHTDGSNGYPQFEPYDRLIATAGVWHIPETWVQQLRVGGICVANRLGSLCPVLIRGVKEADGSLRGAVLAQPAAFMPMHTGNMTFPAYHTIQETPEQYTTMLVSMNVEALFQHEDFLFFLQHRNPALELQIRPIGTPPGPVHFRPHLVDRENNSLLYPVPAQHPHFALCGQASFLSTFENLYDEWTTLGKPNLNHYTFQREDDGQLSFALSPNREKKTHHDVLS